MSNRPTSFRRSLLRFDTEARVGHKSADSSFFGYKTHIAISEERIITVATVTTGKKKRWTLSTGLVEVTKKRGKRHILFKSEQNVPLFHF